MPCREAMGKCIVHDVDGGSMCKLTGLVWQISEEGFIATVGFLKLGVLSLIISLGTMFEGHGKQ